MTINNLTEEEKRFLGILKEFYWPSQQRCSLIQAVAAKFPGSKQDVEPFNLALRNLKKLGYIEMPRDDSICLTDDGLREIGARPSEPPKNHEEE